MKVAHKLVLGWRVREQVVRNLHLPAGHMPEALAALLSMATKRGSERLLVWWPQVEAE